GQHDCVLDRRRAVLPLQEPHRTPGELAEHRTSPLLRRDPPGPPDRSPIEVGAGGRPGPAGVVVPRRPVCRTAPAAAGRSGALPAGHSRGNRSSPPQPCQIAGPAKVVRNPAPSGSPVGFLDARDDRPFRAGNTASPPHSGGLDAAPPHGGLPRSGQSFGAGGGASSGSGGRGTVAADPSS